MEMDLLGKAEILVNVVAEQRNRALNDAAALAVEVQVLRDEVAQLRKEKGKE